MFSFLSYNANFISGYISKTLQIHTHLFTEASLNKMHETLNTKVISQWRFGVRCNGFIQKRSNKN